MQVGFDLFFGSSPRPSLPLLPISLALCASTLEEKMADHFLRFADIPLPSTRSFDRKSYEE